MNDPMPLPLDVKLMNFMAYALFVGFTLLLVGTAALWVASNPWFAVRGITVTGQVTHTNATLLRANVTPRLVGTFFTLDIDKARQAFESIGWVREAQVHREFPNRLKVSLEEHQAAAYWGPESDSTMVNSFGEVFEANVDEVDQDGLPRLSGPDGTAAKVLVMEQTLQPHFEALNLNIEQLDMTPHGGWRVRLDTEGVIELGSGTIEQVLTRTDRFLKTLNQVVSRYGRTPEALETADLRHEDGYAIRLRGVSALTTDAKKK